MIKTILESCKEQLENNTATIREIGITLCRHGYYPYIPTEEQIHKLLYA